MDRKAEDRPRSPNYLTKLTKQVINVIRKVSFTNDSCDEIVVLKGA